MDYQDITKYIIRELGKNRSIGDITITVCEKTGMTRGEAQQVIDQIQFEYSDEIISRQKPILVLLMAVMFIVMGLILSGVMVVLTLNGLIITLLRPFIPVPYLGNLLLLCFSLMIVVGGIVGLLNIFKGLK